MTDPLANHLEWHLARAPSAAAATRVWPVVLLLAFMVSTIASDLPLPANAVTYTVFWPPDGILVVLFLVTLRRDRWLAGAIALVGNFFLELYVARVPLDEAILNAAANISQASLVAIATRYRCGPDPDFARLNTLGRFALLCVVPISAAVSFVYCVIVQPHSQMPFWVAFRSAVLQESLGIIVIAPALYSIVVPRDAALFNCSYAERSLLFGLLTAAEIALFVSASTPALFLVFPILVGISFRLGPRGAAQAILVMSVVALTCAMFGAGPFATLHQTDVFSVRLLLQVFLLAVVYTVLPAAGAVAERLRAQAELKGVHKELVDASRIAGRAEIATSVLHNVGNVLNSVNVSANLASERIKRSGSTGLKRLVAVLEQQELSTFVATERGRHLPSYLAHLSQELAEQQKLTIEELEGLRKHIEHIKEIVAMQQTYAKRVGLAETVHIDELVEDALRMSTESFGQRGIRLVRRFDEIEPVRIDKHRVLQILVNLVRNALHACVESEEPDKQVTVTIARTAMGELAISVTDNGVGIAAENVTRIFNHGFTTRASGHGFGLHSGALAAKELGGSLSGESEGLGHGATFTLIIPLASPEARQVA